MVLGAALLWGTSFPMVEVGLAGGLRPYAFLYYRYVVATLALLAIAIATRRVRFDLFREPRLLLLGVLNLTGYVTQFVGQDLTTASKASLLVNVNVLLTALLAVWLLRERLGRGLLVGCGLGLVGLFLLTTGGDLSALRWSNKEVLGDALAFVTGVCWTIYILVAKRFLDRNEAHAISFTLVIFVVTTVLLLPITLFTDGLAYTGRPSAGLAIVYLGLFASVGAFLLWQQGLQETPASVSSILLLFEVVVALAISIPLLGEDLRGWSAVGAALILTSIYLASRAPATQAAAPAPPPAQAPP